MTCHSERSEESLATRSFRAHVILSRAKNLWPHVRSEGDRQILRSAQNDMGMACFS